MCDDFLNVFLFYDSGFYVELLVLHDNEDGKSDCVAVLGVLKVITLLYTV